MCPDDSIIVPSSPARPPLRRLLEADSVGGFLQTKMSEFVHIRCRSEEPRLRAIERQNRLRHAAGLPLGADSVPDHLRQPFTLAGPISRWNLTTRELTVLGHDMMLVPHLSTVGLDTGRQVMVAGYYDASTGRAVVTPLHSS